METQKIVLSKWDIRFIELTNYISTWSKDNFKVGSTIVNNKRILSTGYNGFPNNFNDSKDRLLDKEVKRKFMIHAEENAILNAIRNNVDINNSTIYISYRPCIHCAKLIVQSGIKKVVICNYDNDKIKEERYFLSDSENLFKECGVELIY